MSGLEGKIAMWFLAYESSKTQESQYLCVTNASYFAFSKQCFVGFEVQAVLMSEPYQIN